MSTFTNFTELFEQKQDLFVQALVPGQVSCQFELPNGRPFPITVQAGPPVSLTQRVPWDAITQSSDLRTLASIRTGNDGRSKPPALRIMTLQEVEAFWEEKALREGYVKPDGSPDVEKAMNPFDDEDDDEIEIRQPSSDDDSDIVQPGAKMYVVDPITPRVLALCLEAQAEDGDNVKRPLARDMIREFESLELSYDDLHHIAQKGYYRTVKSWAERQVRSRSAHED